MRNISSAPSHNSFQRKRQSSALGNKMEVDGASGGTQQQSKSSRKPTDKRSVNVQRQEELIKLHEDTQKLKDILSEDQLDDAFRIYDELLRILWDLTQEGRMIPVIAKLQKKVSSFIKQAQDIQNKLNYLYENLQIIEQQKLSLVNPQDPNQVELATIWFTEIRKLKRELADNYKMESDELNDWHQKFSFFLTGQRY